MPAIDIGQKEPSNIIVALKSGGRAGGYHWRFADAEKPVPPFKKEGGVRHVLRDRGNI